MPILNPELLRNIPLFELLDHDEVMVIAEQLDQRRVLGGEMIFQKGDPGGMMYIVQTGKVEIFLKDKNNEKVTLDTVEANGMFGELSLLDNQPRSASARATEDSELLIIDRHDLEMLFQKHRNAVFDIMAMLSRRIREADVLLTERVVTRNVNEEATPKRPDFGQRLSDILTSVAGDIRFVYFSFIWFFVWITINLGLIPGIEPFDPFPFGLLTMVVSLEAIFLSLFVLISQNIQTKRDKIRNDIEYDVNIKAELGIRDLHDKVEEMQSLLVSHLSRLNTNVDRIQTGKLPPTRGSE
ncbi:MAG: DUF1003 domain-containing protein [Anaerolineae bacterium]|nr:DUF1003 domain-containing protein [Anaerolineae bacterium]MBN8619325.1 DUF1003 domain-containing protein [Anaerolineae bacterium]